MPNVKELLHKLSDIALILFACSSAYKIRFGDWQLSPEYQLPTLVLLLTVYISLNVLGHYSYSSQYTSTKILPRTLLSILAGALITALFLYFSKSGSVFSRLWFTYSLCAIFLFLNVSFLLFDKFLFLSSRLVKIVVLGNLKTANSVKDYFQKNSNRLEVVQNFESDRDTSHRNLESTLDEAAEFIEKRRAYPSQAISEIWVTADVYNKIPPHRLSAVLGNVASRIVWITEVPDSLITLGSLSRAGNFITLNSQLNYQTRLHLIVKSAFDRSLAVLGLVVLAPAFLAISLLIRLDSKGPAFYRQSRYGLNGAEFQIWKFRTMGVEESDLQFRQAIRNDSRVTKLGAFLRKYSIDELPQLINVVQGSMSLVGPRPHPNQLNENFREEVDRYMGRHCMKPGITGLAQINGFRGETSTMSDMENRVILDLEYVNHWSFGLDLSIILKTLSLVWRDKNAF